MRIEMRRGRLIVALVVAVLVATPVCGAATQSQIDFSVCPTITTNIYVGSFAAPSGSGPGVFSPGAIVIPPGNGACTTPAASSDLGTFLTTQNPFGVFMHVSGGENCSTNPPERGVSIGATQAALTVSVVQRGFCPTTLTISAPLGPYDGLAFPIGSLPFGSYSVTATFPDQTVYSPETHQSTSWLASRAHGTLHVGTTFTETDANALARPGKSSTFAALLQNTVAGPGAGELVWTKTANPSIVELKGTDYYACGTINIAATVTYGKRGADGVVRLTGKGSLTGGAGNYEGIKGAFTVTGSYSAKTNRGTFKLKGTATY